MKKVLFYTANGVGLGHLRRTSLIAKAIRDVAPKTKILFVSMCTNAALLKDLKLPVVKLCPITDKLINNKTQYTFQKRRNEKIIQAILKKIKPDVFILDIHIKSNFSFPQSLFTEKFLNIKKVLIYRLTAKKDFVKDMDKLKNKFNLFDKIIIPHSKEELKQILTTRDYIKLSKDRKVCISGPILRSLNQQRVDKCIKKYNLDNKEFLITIALGGGGELILGDCEAPISIVERVLKNYKVIKKFIPNVKMVLVTGPLFKHATVIKSMKKNNANDVQIVHYEENLMELFSLSKLVISSAGYNIVNEIIISKTPAILVPLRRGCPEQFEKALYLQKKGLVRVFDRNSGKKLSNLIIDCKNNINKIKLSYQNFFYQKLGNQTAAKLILNEN